MQSDPLEAFFRMLGWGAVLGVGELIAWAIGLGLVFLLTFLIPGLIVRALVRAPLLMGLVLLMKPAWRMGPWPLKSVLLGLGAAALGALLLELRWNDPDDSWDYD